MIRKGYFKLCYSHGGSLGEPSDVELYDLNSDPGEFKNLGDQAEYEDKKQELLSKILERWENPETLDRKIRTSQKNRLLIRDVLGEKAIF